MKDGSSFAPDPVAQPFVDGRRRALLGEGVDFASRRAARGKMQLWMTAFTAAAAVAVLIVVFLSVLYGG